MKKTLKRIAALCASVLLLSASVIPAFAADSSSDSLLGSSVESYIFSQIGNAIYTVDGVEGVYIFHESTVRFRRIQVIYRGDGYCIAEESPEGEDSYLSVNDLLITEGKNLYDGKVY